MAWQGSPGMAWTSTNVTRTMPTSTGTVKSRRCRRKRPIGRVPLHGVGHDHVAGGQRRAIGELDPLAEVERPLGQIGVGLVGLSQARLDRRAAYLVAQQRVEDLFAGPQALAVRLVAAIEAQ